MSLCAWYFFFFKRKTAYEMRISDWSSDVCSSDLRLTAENYKPQTIKAYRGLLKRLISLIEAAGISPQDLTAERAAELVRNDVLPKALPVITGVRGWYGAPRGGVAQ